MSAPTMPSRDDRRGDARCRRPGARHQRRRPRAGLRHAPWTTTEPRRHVDMTLTSAACPLTDVIEDQARAALGGPSLASDVQDQLGVDAAVGSGQDHRRGREQLRAGWMSGLMTSGTATETRRLEVAPDRFTGWIESFADRHNGLASSVADHAVTFTAPDGAVAECLVPFPPVPATDGTEPIELAKLVAAHATADRTGRSVPGQARRRPEAFSLAPNPSWPPPRWAAGWCTAAAPRAASPSSGSPGGGKIRPTRRWRPQRIPPPPCSVLSSSTR